MRFLKIGIYFLLALILQNVVLARLAVRGVAPDLILVSIIIFSVLLSVRRATAIAFGGGFLQDLFSSGVFFNTLTRVIIAYAVNLLKESVLASPYYLAAGLVVLFTLLSLVFEGSLLPSLMFVATIYNLISFPFLYPIVERLCGEEDE